MAARHWPVARSCPASFADRCWRCLWPGHRDHRKYGCYSRKDKAERSRVNALEHPPENSTLAEPLVAGTRERRVIRDFVLDAQATELTIGQVHLHLTAKQSLRADGEDIAHDQHADYEYWINRRA